jgi:proline iminopeptidase
MFPAWSSLSATSAIRSALVVAAALTLALGSGCVSSSEPDNLVPATAKDDPSLPRFELEDGTKLHLETFGDPADPTVIVLHGGPGGDFRSYQQFTDLEDEFFVVLWDQRGTGLSERVPDEELDGPQYLEDLVEIGAEFSPDAPFHLVGHSWGGAYAAYFAENHPERVSELVLIEPGALNPEAAKSGNVAGIDFFDARFHEYLNSTDYLIPDDDERADYAYLVALAGFGDREDDLLGYPFWRLGYRANVSINDWQGNFDGSHTFDATDGLDAFDGRTLLISGEADGRLGRDFQMEYHAPHLPNLHTYHVADATHSELVMRDEVINITREFMSGGTP